MAPRTLDLPGTGAATHPPADFVGASVSALVSMRGLPDRQPPVLEGTGQGIPGQVCVQMCLRAFHGGGKWEREQRDEHDRPSLRLFRCDGG